MTTPVMEVFGPTIQGEGIMTGTITHFLRTGGCPLRCSWCDSMPAVDPEQVKLNATRMTPGEMFSALETLPGAPWLTLTGGDPCMWKELGDLIYMCNTRDIRVAVETQGSLFPEWLQKADVVTFSPKPPSSGNEVDIKGILTYLADKPQHQRVCIKVVVAGSEDLEYAFDCLARIPMQEIEAFYLNACSEVLAPGEAQASPFVPAMRAIHTLDKYRELSETLMHLGRNLHHKVHVGCQQHVLLWPESNEGV